MIEEPAVKVTSLLLYLGDTNHESVSSILCNSDDSFFSAQEAFVDLFDKLKKALSLDIHSHHICEYCRAERDEVLVSEIFMNIINGDVHDSRLDTLAELGWNLGSFTLDCISCLSEPTRIAIIPDVENQMKYLEFYPGREIKVDGEYIISIAAIKRELPIDDSIEE